MIEINYPEPQFRIREDEGRHYVFDAIRKAWLQLTEEEWVRQNFVNYLVQQLHYPSALIALEKEIQLNDLKKRFDILVYSAIHQPWMLVECKAPKVALSPAILEQVLRYNMSVPVEFLVITNGHQTLGWQKKESKLELLKHLPLWPV